MRERKNEHKPSKLSASVNRLNRPHRVPPPNEVPLTLSKSPSLSTFTIDTPDPMLTNKQGNCMPGSESLSNVTENFGGLADGRGRSSGLGISVEGGGCGGDVDGVSSPEEDSSDEEGVGEERSEGRLR